MSDESSAKAIYSVRWGCDDGRDVVCYAVGTETEAERCRGLLHDLRSVGGDDRFTYSIRKLDDEEYAEEIDGLEDWEADPEDLGGLIGRVLLDIVEAGDEAKQGAEDEIGELEAEIEGLMERVASKKAAIVAIDLKVCGIISAGF